MKSISFTNSHNHPPPTDIKLSREVREKCKAILQNHEVSPTNVHQQIVQANINNNIEHSSLTVPTRQQLRQMKHYIKTHTLPSNSAIENIKALDAKLHFLLDFSLHPHFSLVIATPEALDLLARHGVTMCIDGTFALFQVDNYQLVTIMVPVDGIFTPTAWSISDSKDKEVYAHFLQLLHQHTHGRFNPSFIFCDFEAALRAGCKIAFKDAQILGDAFHFVQANIQYFEKNSHRYSHFLTFSLYLSLLPLPLSFFFTLPPLST